MFDTEISAAERAVFMATRLRDSAPLMERGDYEAIIGALRQARMALAAADTDLDAFARVADFFARRTEHVLSRRSQEQPAMAPQAAPQQIAGAGTMPAPVMPPPLFSGPGPGPHQWGPPMGPRPVPILSDEDIILFRQYAASWMASTPGYRPELLAAVFEDPRLRRIFGVDHGPVGLSLFSTYAATYALDEFGPGVLDASKDEHNARAAIDEWNRGVNGEHERRQRVPGSAPLAAVAPLKVDAPKPPGEVFAVVLEWQGLVSNYKDADGFERGLDVADAYLAELVMGDPGVMPRQTSDEVKIVREALGIDVVNKTYDGQKAEHVVKTCVLMGLDPRIGEAFLDALTRVLLPPVPMGPVAPDTAQPDNHTAQP
jgi:hypothetical protein